MGSMLISQCKCGFESDFLFVGGGMVDFKYSCEIPFHCDDCELVFLRDILKVEIDDNIICYTPTRIKNYNLCPKCHKKVHYYGEIGEDTFEDDGVNHIFDWGLGDLDNRYFLKEQSHYCPKCKKENLEFHSVGNWD